MATLDSHPNERSMVAKIWNLQLGGSNFHLAFQQFPTCLVLSWLGTQILGVDKDYLNIMLVSWVEGMAYREGMLSMLDSDWLRLDRAWKQITLC